MRAHFRRRSLRGGVVAAFAVSWLACSAADSEPEVAAPAAPTAVARLPDARIRIADPVDIDVSVHTAPGHRVLPPRLPSRLSGFDNIEWLDVAVDREQLRWVHHHRIRLRALETGQFEWPAIELTVAAPDASLARTSLPPLTLDVVSILAEHPGRTAPFGTRT